MFSKLFLKKEDREGRGGERNLYFLMLSQENTKKPTEGLFSSSFDLLKHLKTCIDEQRIFPRRICFVNLHPHPTVLANVGSSPALELHWTFVSWEPLHDGNRVLCFSYLPPSLVPIRTAPSVLGVVVEPGLNFAKELLWTSTRARWFERFVFKWGSVEMLVSYLLCIFKWLCWHVPTA